MLGGETNGEEKRGKEKPTSTPQDGDRECKLLRLVDGVPGRNWAEGQADRDSTDKLMGLACDALRETDRLNRSCIVG
jgi:hypothetical protein